MNYAYSQMFRELTMLDLEKCYTTQEQEVTHLLKDIFPAIPISSAANFVDALTCFSGLVSPYKGAIDFKIRLRTQLWFHWNTECVELRCSSLVYRACPSWMFYHFLCKLDFHNVLQVKPVAVPLGIASPALKILSLLRLRRLSPKRYINLLRHVLHWIVHYAEKLNVY